VLCGGGGAGSGVARVCRHRALLKEMSVPAVDAEPPCLAAG